MGWKTINGHRIHLNEDSPEAKKHTEDMMKTFTGRNSPNSAFFKKTNYTINNGWNSPDQYSSNNLTEAKKHADEINGIVFSHHDGKTKNIYRAKKVHLH